MITIEQAKTLRYREELLHVTVKDSRGNPARCRVNGKCQTWKSRPGDFKLPVKHGLRNCFYITERNAHEWRTHTEFAIGAAATAIDAEDAARGGL